MDFKSFIHNGKIELLDQAQISLFNIEYTYGFGVYESLRVQKGIPFFLSDHLDRLMTSAQLIQLEHVFSIQDVSDWVHALIANETEKTFNLKILLIGAQDPNKTQLYILPLSPKFPDKKLYRHGAKVISTYYERLFPQAKSLNMLPSYLAYRAAQQQSAYDSLLIDRKDRIIEGTRTNFFAVRNRELITPSNKDVLHGVARRNLIHVARENEFTVREEDIYLRDISKYDGAILTSTSSKVMPICEVVDEYVFETIHSDIKELMKLYNEFIAETQGVFPRT